MRVTGWPVGTFVRGRRVNVAGELVTVDRRASAVPGDAEGVSNRSSRRGSGVAFKYDRHRLLDPANQYVRPGWALTWR